MKKLVKKIINTSKDLYRVVLDSEQDPFLYSLFWDDIFNKTYQKLQNRNEAMII
jgi:hypothetical protein